MRITEDKDTLEIVDRFFEAIKLLRAHKIIGGLKVLTDNHNLNRWNINAMKADRSHNYFRASWIAYLYKDYHVNPIWMLTGEGDFFEAGYDKEKVKKLQDNCKREKVVADSVDNEAIAK